MESYTEVEMKSTLRLSTIEAGWLDFAEAKSQGVGE